MTPRLLVVADNRSLSLGLAGQDFDVLDVQPEHLGQSSAPDQSTDLVIVGVERPSEAVAVLTTCRQRHGGVPMLLVRSDGPEWATVDTAISGQVEVLSLPVTRVSLVAAVRRLIASDEETPATHAATPDLTSAPPEGEVRAPARQAAGRIMAARSSDALRERLARRAEVSHESATMSPAPPDDGGAQPAESLPRLREPASRQYAEWDQLRHRSTKGGGIGSLIQDLLSRLHELVDVRDAADALASEVAALAQAPYSAVLLPDGGIWRVCGSTGLRPLELRYVVEPDGWLADTVVTGLRGVIIEDSDIARQRLGGAPLAHHRHLMATPIPATQGLVILARDEDAFDESQLSAVVDACNEVGALLSDALRIRSLARALTDFRDPPE
jgi:hypothetical protein